MAGKLTDKVAIVTGASSGIGEATALALASVGATVVIACPSKRSPTCPRSPYY